MDHLRLVMVEWCPCCRANFRTGSHCSRYKTHGGWLQGLTALDTQELSSYVGPASISGAVQSHHALQVRARHLL
jgi:hypothetical protein